MALKAYKPTSAGRRSQTVLDFSDLTKKKPEKSLVVSLSKTGGRNSSGRITSRYIGGGHKQKYRRVDFKREKLEIPARVAAIEYDPNRSANIALLHYQDGEKRYILAPVDLKVGDTLLAGEDRSLYDVSKARAAEAGQGLGVKLCIASPSLAALPWEYLGDAQRIVHGRGRSRPLRVPQRLGSSAIRRSLGISGGM